MEKKERDAIAPPDFSRFRRLQIAENLLWNVQWGVSLSNAPSLIKLCEGHDVVSIWLSDEELVAFCKECMSKPISQQLEHLYLSHFHKPPCRVDDGTASAFLQAFPKLETLILYGCNLSLNEPFLRKLRRMSKLRTVDFAFCKVWTGPTRAWLNSSTKLFPTSLTRLRLAQWDWDHVAPHEHNKKEYLAFVKQSFDECLSLIEASYEPM